MAWQTPVIDRTADDVAYAIIHQMDVSDLKGAWNISDANRVIDNSIYLRDLLASYGYIISFTNQPHMIVSDFPYITSFIKVMKDNVIALVNGFYASGNPPITYSEHPNFTSANNIEINLKIINDILELMIQSFRICGTFSCGTSFRL